MLLMVEVVVLALEDIECYNNTEIFLRPQKPVANGQIAQAV